LRPARERHARRPTAERTSTTLQQADATAPRNLPRPGLRGSLSSGEAQMAYDSERDRKRYAEDSEYRAKLLAKNRAYRRRNMEFLNAKFRERYATDLEFWGNIRAHRRSRDLKRHGLTVPEYNAILSRQGGACGICERPFTRTPCVDHCHITGWVRGLLCQGCNLALGHLEDNPAFAYKAGAYLEHWLKHLLEVCIIEEDTYVTSNDDAAEESNAERMIRQAIVHELQQPFGVEPPPASDWLQALARALIVKAGQSDVQALKEVFDRAGGRTAALATSAPRQLTLSWKYPPPASKKPETKSRARNSARSTGDTNTSSAS
jgi:Recombination endonuclease VII